MSINKIFPFGLTYILANYILIATLQTAYIPPSVNNCYSGKSQSNLLIF
jgi:hypothetical protein